MEVKKEIQSSDSFQVSSANDIPGLNCAMEKALKNV